MVKPPLDIMEPPVPWYRPHRRPTPSPEHSEAMKKLLERLKRESGHRNVKGAGKRKCKGGSLHSIWDKIWHPIDNIKEWRAEQADEDMGYDLLDGLTDDDIEDLLSGIKRRSKRASKNSVPANENAPSDEDIEKLLAALSSGAKDPEPVGTIRPLPKRLRKELLYT